MGEGPLLCGELRRELRREGRSVTNQRQNARKLQPDCALVFDEPKRIRYNPSDCQSGCAYAAILF